MKKVSPPQKKQFHEAIMVRIDAEADLVALEERSRKSRQKKQSQMEELPADYQKIPSLQKIADAGKVRLDFDAINALLACFQSFYGSVVIGGISGWGMQPLPAKDLRSIQLGFRRIARSFLRASKDVRLAVSRQKVIPDFARRKSDEIITALEGAAGELFEEERAVESGYRSKAKGRIGKPAFALFVESLYSIYRRAGGNRHYTQGKDSYTFGGDAIEFILAACEKIAPMLPESALPPRGTWRNHIGETVKAIAAAKRKRIARTRKSPVPLMVK